MTIDGAPWFVAADVCRALGLQRHPGTGSYAHHYSKLGSEDCRVCPAGTYMLDMKGVGADSPKSLITLISESGLYKLVLRSDKPQARPFQSWVTRDVLPAIRKTGIYVMGEEKLNDPNLAPSDLDALDRIADLAGSLTVTEAAKALQIPPRDLGNCAA